MEKNMLKIVPDQLIFRDSNIGEIDSIDVWVTNISKKPTQIRYTLQPDSKFEFISNTSSFTPPGLEAKGVLKYNCTSNEIIKEKLIVSTPEFRQEIPILAIPPCPRIIPDNQHLDIGQIGVDTTTKITFSISNLGTKEGQFQISCDSESIEFIPKTGNLPPNKSVDIAATIHPKIVGDFEYKIVLTADEQIEEPEFLIVKGKAIKHSLILTVDDKEVNSIDFQTIFIGQKRVVEAKIVNTGPYKRSFVIMPPHETPRTGSRAEKTAQYMNNNENLVFKAYPAEGTLNPYASSLIRFVFNPPLDSTFDGDSEVDFKHYSSVEIVETSQNIAFQMTGKVVQHLITIPVVDYFFDTIPVMSKASQTLVIKNRSKFLPTAFVVKPIAHFRFEPSKGVIHPNQSKKINIIFYPKSLGDIQTHTHIVFDSGLVKKEINLVGKSTQTGKDLSKFKRVDPWEENDDVKYRAQHPNDKYAYDLNTLKKRKEMRKKFDEYLSSPRERREENRIEKEHQHKLKEKAKKYLEQSVGVYTDAEFEEYIQQQIEEEALNAGMDDMDMTPPEPPIRISKAPLVIDNPERFGLITRKSKKKEENVQQRNNVQQNDAVLVKKKFKPKATTPNEINECSHPLTPAQQLLVTASHETMNLGEVSVFSTIARSFSVTNNLQQSILVTVNYEYDELSESGPQSQVIPPKQTGGFDIIFCSTKPQNFIKTITYTVNGVHSYSVNIAAQVIPIDLQLSKSIVEFRFAGDSTIPVIKEFITVHNKNNAVAQYLWEGISEPFSISTEQGFIEANQQINVEITYTPTTKSHEEQTIVLNVSGGQSKALKLVSDVGSPKCSINKKTLSFGLIPLGITRTQQIRLRNTSDDDAIFSIFTKNTHELTISPAGGRVGARETQTIQVNLKSIQARVFDIPVTVSICGAQPIVFNITGQSELPKIVMTNTEFDFGKVYVGSYQSLEGTIKNVGAIPAVLYLDLSSHPEFRIESETVISNGENEKVNSISLVSDPFFVTKCIPSPEYIANTQISAFSSMASFLESTRTDESNDLNQSDSPSGLVYKIQIMDNSQMSFKFVFQPVNTGEHAFELPVTMMNMNLSSSMHLQPFVSAEAMNAPLLISTSSIDFGVSPIYDPLNPNMRKMVKTLSIFNKSDQVVSWRFPEDKDNEISSAFTIEPLSGTLSPGGSSSVNVFFIPSKNIPHNYYVPLYAKGKDEAIIAKVQLTGVGTNNMFSVSNTDICMPAVPLNTRTQVEAYIINDGFIDGNLKATLSADENQFPVKITFPEGNQLQHIKEKLPILVSFQSSKPTSFSVNVAITDDNGHACNFTVTCTADNSIFTLFAYYGNKSKPSVRSSRSEFGKFMNNSELTSRFISTTDYLDLKSVQWESSFSQLTIKFVQRYFNALMFSTQISDFPDSLITNQGLVITEMIANHHSGKRMPQSDERINTAVDDALAKRYEAVKKLINTLKGLGALLGSVRPEFLLSRADFIQVMRTKIMKRLLGLDSFGSPSLESLDQNILGEIASSKAFSSSLIDRLKVLENLYEQLSIESWMIVLLQCFKIFGLSRVQSEKFNSIPGVQAVQKQIKAQKNPDDLVGIIFKKFKDSSLNVHEGTILKWLSLYATNACNDLRGIQNNFHSLSDGYAFCTVMSYHTSMFKGTPTFIPRDKHQKEQNAIDFANALKIMKLSFSPMAEEIVYGDDCVNAMIGAYLIGIIPHFLPISTIEFSGVLHKPVIRSVTITNPSKSEIKYTAIFQGDSSYQLLSDSVVVGPNQTADFQIQYQAHTIRPLAGRLTLIPGKPRYVSQGDASSRTASNRPPTYSAPVVVDLISNISVNAPDHVINMDTHIYQESHLEIPVKNLLGTPSRLRVYTQVTKIADENGKDIDSSKTIVQQIASFVAKHDDEMDENLTSQDSSSQFIKNHKTFLVTQKVIEFKPNENETTIDIDFVPISLGTYRCLILFIDDEHGEFVYEVIGKSELPPPIDFNGKVKTEAQKRITVSVPLDISNPSLIHAIAYAFERNNSNKTGIYNNKIKNEVTRQQHVLENVFKTSYPGANFKIASSSTQFFEVPSEAKTKSPTLSSPSLPTYNIPVIFKPPKAGEYPCKLILFSEHDIRVIGLKGICIHATREVTLSIQTVTGKTIKQEIPFNNPSDEMWQYKVTTQGDAGFTVPTRFTIKGKSSSSLAIQFTPQKVGEFKAELDVVNLTKESTVIYKVTATVEEPPAEDKIVLDAQARVDKVYEIKLSRFTLNPIQVTTTIPVLEFEPELAFQSPTYNFPVKISASRSGIAVGTITFTDTITKAYVWYIMEIHISAPVPEQTIKVATVAKQKVSVSIPISNPKDRPSYFKVSMQDNDIQGEGDFVVPPNGSYNYSITVSPVKAVNKIASVYFYSDEDGEFWYNIQITATDPEPRTIAPMSAPIGKTATTYIQLENPTDKQINFRIDNENPTSFQVVAKRILTLLPLEKKRVEVKYIPSSVGIKETSTISFRSGDVGDWIYKLTGSGKPPQPLSPTIISSVLSETNSALILFANPFPTETKFTVTMTTDNANVFSFLLKKKAFTLDRYGEEFQIPFTFSPNELGQFNASIIIASQGPVHAQANQKDTIPSIRWIYPIIGNAIASNLNEVKHLRTKSNEPIETNLEFTLIGECEVFEPSEYRISLDLPQNVEFLKSQITLSAVETKQSENGVILVINTRFSPMRPIQCTTTVTIKNKLSQEWQFRIEIVSELGKPVDTIVIESLLGKVGTAKIVAPKEILSTKPFHAYFTASSASEFSVTPHHGIASPEVELPLEIQFLPKTYGKKLKGVLIIDMIDSLFAYEIIGKMPEYVPPTPGASSLANVIKKPKKTIRVAGSAQKIKRPHVTPRKDFQQFI